MNVIVRENFPLLDHALALRHQLMDMLTDEDLTYRLPGSNLSLGELCREMGEVEQSYIDSFKTFKQDWSYRHDDPAVETSVAKLSAWLLAQEEALKAVLESLSDEVITTQLVDRGDFKPPVIIQFHIHHEALLIFYAKASIYLKALDKPFPDQWESWIG
ncbi:DinB family protein [Chloroflexota bacterium]